MTVREAAVENKIAVLGLGPATVTELPDVKAVQITIDGAIPDKAATLQRWLDVIRVVDMTCGVRDKHDPELKLHLRGLIAPNGPLGLLAKDLFPTGKIAIATAAFHKVNEAKKVELIEAWIESQQVEELLRELAELEDQ